MAKRPTMIFKRGDGCSYYFGVPKESWVLGSIITFTAKENVDDDNTDSTAVIKKQFTDQDIVPIDHPMYVPENVTYELVFTKEDTSNIPSYDQSNRRFQGEISYKVPGGDPVTAPKDDNYIDVIVYMDIGRGA